MPDSAEDVGSALQLRSALTDPFENFPIGVYRTAPDGTLLYANRALRELLHSSSIESLFSTSVAANYLHPTAREEWLEKIEREGSLAQEMRIRRHDDSIVWVLDSATAVRDSTGKTTCYEGALQDITQRKAAEDGLAKTHSRFQSMIENSSD